MGAGEGAAGKGWAATGVTAKASAPANLRYGETNVFPPVNHSHKAIFGITYQAQPRIGIAIQRCKASSRRSFLFRGLIATPCFAGDERVWTLAGILQIGRAEAVGEELADAVALDLAAVAAGAEDLDVGAR